MLTSAITSRTKLLPPLLLFGYAAAANVDIRWNVWQAADRLPSSLDTIVHGGFTQEVETVYKDELPHRQVAFELVGAARYLLLGEGRRGVVVGKDGWLFSDEEFRGAADAELGIGESVRQIAAVAADLRAKGSRLVLVPLPAKNDIYRDHVGDTRFSDMSAARYRDFVAALAAAGIDRVDSRATLIAARKDGPVFLRTDTHWTPLGARAVADEAARQTGAAPDGTFRLSDDAPKAVEGDLVRLVTGGVFARLVGLDGETVVPQEAEDAAAAPIGDLFGDDARFPIVLVGTSYSANEAWSFASYLKTAFSKDVLNVAEIGRGPVFPMRKYLAGTDPAGVPPETVIWEFPVRYLTQPDLWTDRN